MIADLVAGINDAGASSRTRLEASNRPSWRRARTQARSSWAARGECGGGRGRGTNGSSMVNN